MDIVILFAGLKSSEPVRRGRFYKLVWLVPACSGLSERKFAMSPFFLSIVNLVLSVLFGKMTWQEAVAKWLEEQIAVQGSREAVEGQLAALKLTYENHIDSSTLDDEVCCASENVGKFGDGKFLEFLRTVDWAKVIAIIMQFMPKSEPAPGPVQP
jgi:hypothetical protein